MRLKSTHPQITAKTNKTSPKSQTHSPSPILSRAGLGAVECLWLREQGWASQTDGDSSRYCTGGREDAAAAREHPALSSWGVDGHCKGFGRPSGTWGMQSLRKVLLCCPKDSSVHHQLSLMLCSPSRTSSSLAALCTNPGCGTVGIVPAAQGVTGNSSDLCPRALLGHSSRTGTLACHRL